MTEHEVPTMSEVPVEGSEEQHIGSNVCDQCAYDNLTKNVGILQCDRCKNPYCTHFASKIDAGTYCVGCLSNIDVTIGTVVKTVEHYNEQTDTVTKYSRRAKEIRIEGLDWLFVQRKINTLTDAELNAYIEYHRAYCNLLLVESETRRNAKAHRYAGVKVVPTTASIMTTTVTTTKKSTTTKSNKAQAQVEALMNSLLGSMSLDQLSALLKKGGK